MTPDEQDEHARDLGKAVAAYDQLMDAVVPESQYWQGEREDSDRVECLSGILDDAIARRRERLRQERGS